MNPLPLISVIIPSYNHAAYIEESIRSVLASTIQDFELIVVDDGSTDDSCQVVRDIRDPRIRFFTQSNAGGHQAMNRAVSVARGTWLAFLNSDDKYHANKLEEHLKFHTKCQHLEASASRLEMITASGLHLPLDHPLSCWYGYVLQVYRDCARLLDSLVVTNHIATSSALFMRKHVFDELGGFVPLKFCHDLHMVISLATRGRFRILQKPLISYRVHDKRTMDTDRVQAKLEHHLVAAWHLWQRTRTGQCFDKYAATLDSIPHYPSINRALLVFFLAVVGEENATLESLVRIVNEPDHPVTLEGRRFFEQTQPKEWFSSHSSVPKGWSD